MHGLELLKQLKNYFKGEYNMKEMTIFERIYITRSNIAKTEKRLEQLKQDLDNLYATLIEEFYKQRDLELQELFNRIGMKRLPLSELLKLLEEQQ